MVIGSRFTVRLVSDDSYFDSSSSEDNYLSSDNSFSSEEGSSSLKAKLGHVAHLVKNVNDQGLNSVQYAILDNDVPCLRELLKLCSIKRVSADEMIIHVDIHGMNALQYATAKGNIECVELLLEYLSKENKYLVISHLNFDEKNCLQLAALSCPDNPTIVELILKDLPSPNVRSIILNENGEGNNVLAIALAADKVSILLTLQRQLADEDFAANEDIILSAEGSSLVQWAIEEGDDRLLLAVTDSRSEAVSNWLTDNTHFSMTSPQIGIVSPLSKTFIIPSVQGGAKKHAIICFNPTDRSNALAEVKELVDAFMNKGFTVHVHEWTCYTDLRGWLVDMVDKIAGEVSILALFIMSHGNSGTLQGDGGSGQITDIINDARQGIPSYIPLVVGIQACQKSKPKGRLEEGVDAKTFGKGETQHVVLKARNCILMMATVHDAFAYRMNFIPAFCQELARSHNTPICEIFAGIQSRMESHEETHYRNQLAELRVTGSYQLRL